MGSVRRCGVTCCKYNIETDCTADDIDIEEVFTSSGFHPMCDTYEEKEYEYADYIG